MSRPRNGKGRPKAAKRARIMQKTGGRCWYCGDPACTSDHVIPWSRKGAFRLIQRNHISNLLPACYPCNTMKSNATLDEFRACIQSFFGVHEFRFWGEGFLPLEKL